MTSDDFIEQIFKRVLNENTNIYSNLLENTNVNEATDANWQKVLEVYQKLDDSEKSKFRGFIRQIITDTISNIFAVLDGVTWLETQTDDFVLSHSNTKLNGDLQDVFLAKTERET